MDRALLQTSKSVTGFHNSSEKYQEEILPFCGSCERTIVMGERQSKDSAPEEEKIELSDSLESIVPLFLLNQCGGDDGDQISPENLLKAGQLYQSQLQMMIEGEQKAINVNFEKWQKASRSFEHAIHPAEKRAKEFQRDAIWQQSNQIEEKTKRLEEKLANLSSKLAKLQEDCLVESEKQVLKHMKGS